VKGSIFFKGFYGFKNIGDDIFVAVAEHIANNYFGYRAIFVGKNLPITAGKSLKISLRNRGVCRIVELICSCVATKIVIFGGSTISKVGNIKKLYYIINKLNFLSRKTATIGTSVSIPKEDGEKAKTVEFISKMHYVAVRDRRSEQDLKKENLSCIFSFDAAILLDDVFVELRSIERDNSSLGICMCINKDESEEEIVERTVRFVKRVVEDCKIEKIIIFRFYDDQKDLLLCEKLISNCSVFANEIKFVDYTRELKEFCIEFTKCSMIFGSKLHAGIMAYTLGIPFMLDEYHEKCTDFLSTINHKYYFYRNDIEKSISNFEMIWEKKVVPDLISSTELKKVFYDAIEGYVASCL